MKKVLALMLAVLMMATVAFAATKKANISPSGSIKIGREQSADDADGVNNDAISVIAKTEKGEYYAITKNAEADDIPYVSDAFDNGIKDLLLRSVNSSNYSITNVKYRTGGKNLIAGVNFDDANDLVKISMKEDLTNTSVKDFEVEFKLKGKVKFSIRNDSDAKAMESTGKTVTDTSIGAKYTLPDVTFKIVGTVGYGKVEVNVAGDDNDEIDNIETVTDADGNNLGYDKEDDIVKFTTSSSKRTAGAYAADAILTEEYDVEALTLVARVYSGDTLFLNVGTDPDRELLDLVEDVTADLDFYTFTENEKFVHFNSNATLCFENADEDCIVYQVKNNKLFEVGEFSDEYGCQVVTTRTLGKYIVSTEKLTLLEGTAAENPANQNPDTGANDVVGIATALAAVALVSAAAISLKK